ncbi:hypothetical protein D3C81_1558800 [compost metagenome]
MRLLQAGRLAIDQYTERQDAHAQDVFRYRTEVGDTGQLRRVHIDRSLTDDRHAIDGEHTEYDHQQGDKGKTEKGTGRDIQITQGHS